MYRFVTNDLEKLRQRLRVHLTFIPFFRALEIEPEQERYFMRHGVDNARLLARSTVRARRGRWGYYRRAKRRGVSSDLPYGVWTGNTLDHTSEKKGRKTVRVGVMTIQHNLRRKISRYWDLKGLERYVQRAVEVYFDRALDIRKRPMKRVRLRAA